MNWNGLCDQMLPFVYLLESIFRLLVYSKSLPNKILLSNNIIRLLLRLNREYLFI